MAIRIGPPRTQSQSQITACAIACVGAPFRLHGRSPETGLDCVGIVSMCLSNAGYRFETPTDYGIRGDFESRAQEFFADTWFQNVEDASLVAGDILMFRPGPRQIHFAVLARGGAVHAHLGLRRVVLTPLPLPYGQIAHWRFQGD